MGYDCIKTCLFMALAFTHNSPEHKHLRQILRKRPTNAEVYLWSKLRNNNLGVKFRRQFGIGPYIVDFYCHEKKLVIELDGITHDEESVQLKDKDKQVYIESQGYKCLRYTDHQVMSDMESVLQDILQYLSTSNRTPPNLP